MKTLLSALAGFALIGALGATQVNAQGVHVRINKGGKSVEVNTRRSGEGFRKPERVETKPSGHYITVQEKVWVAGCYVTEHRDVWVEGHYDIVKEARKDRHGCVIYVSVKKWHPGHYECQEVKVYKPGYFKIVEKQVWVEDTCDTGHGHGHGRGR